MLISCQIKDFGKLHDFEWKFDTGLNSIVAENGWGKTTLTAFIVVMFYGFQNEHKRSLIDNERKRYRPWQEGIYGGKIFFVTSGKKYLLERTFGMRPKEDHFALYDATTNLPSHDFTTKIGEEIFGIDRTSFENTLYIAQQNCQTDVTPGINAKIGDLASEQADMNSYQLVQQKFKEQLNHLTPRRKTGELYQIHDKIAKIAADLERQPIVLRQVAEKKEKIAVLIKQRQKLLQQQFKIQQQLQQSSKTQDQQLLEKKFQLLMQQQQEIVEKVDTLKHYFLNQVPLLAELEQQQKINEQIKLIEKMLEGDDKDGTERLKQLRQRHIDQLTLKQLVDMKNKNQQLNELKHQEQQSGLSIAELKHLSVIRTAFEQHPVNNFQLDELSSLLSHQQKLQDHFEKKQVAWKTWQEAVDSNQRRRSQPRTENSKIWQIGGALLLILGILFFKESSLVGLSLILLGCGIFIWKTLQHPSQATGKKNSQFSNLEQELQELQQKLKESTNQFKQRLQELGLNWSLNTAPIELNKLKNDYLDLQQLQQRQKQSISATNLQKMQQLQSELQNFLNYYQLQKVTDYATALQELQFELQEDQRLEQQVKHAENAIEKRRLLIQNQQKFFRKYKLTTLKNFGEELQKMRDRVITLQREEQRLAGIKEVVQNFANENPGFQEKQFSKPRATQPSSLSELSKSLTILKQELETNQQQAWKFSTDLEKFQKQLIEFSRLANEKLELQQEQSKLKAQFELLTRTSKYLAQAKNNFSARYMNPIMKNFTHYYQKLAQEGGQQYRLDAELNLTAEAYGTQRHLALLSEGYQDLLGICRRLSLIDAMYQQEKPPIIFDDPFVNLDAKKLQGGMNLLQELAKEHQVIYLTCHPGRTLKLKNQ